MNAHRRPPRIANAAILAFAALTLFAGASRADFTITPIAGSGGVIVPSAPVTVVGGGEITFAITPEHHCHLLADVLVDGISTGGVSSYTFVDVQANHTIEAVFALRGPLTVTADAGPGGTIAPQGMTAVPCGGSVSYLIQTENVCQSIADVRVDGVSVGPVTSYSFTNVHVNHSIEATFVLLGPLTITPVAGWGGTITPSTVQSVPCRGNRTFTIASDGCHAIANVLVDGAPIGAVTTYTFADVRANHTIEAVFGPLAYYSITASAGPGGTITPSGAQSVACGDGMLYVITSDACHTIDVVTVDGIPVGSPGTFAFSDVRTHHTIMATFLARPATILATAGLGGTIAPAGTRQVTCGTDQTFDILPAPGSVIARVVVDGVSQGAIPSYTFAAVQGDHTIHALFEDNTPPTVRLIYPNGGENLFVGDPSKISWTAHDNSLVLEVDLWISRSGAAGPWEPIVTGVPNTGTYVWPVVTGPGTNTGDDPGYTAMLRVVARDAIGLTALDESDAGVSIYRPGNLAVGAGDEAKEFELVSVGPNPSRGPVAIQYAVAREARVGLSVIDLQGRTVASLVDGSVRPGRHRARWNGTLEHGETAPAGVYFVRYQSPAKTTMRRVVIVRP